SAHWRSPVKPVLACGLRRRVRFGVLVPLFVVNSLALRAQDAASPKFAIFSGAGAVATQQYSRGEIQAGASFDEAPPGAWGDFSFEGGYLGPWARLHAGSAFTSVDYMASWAFGPKATGRTPSGTPYWTDRGWKLLPFASAGYTRLFGTGNAVN